MNPLPNSRILRELADFANKCGSGIDRLFAPAKDNGINPAPLFIMGLPRSGTTLTYQLIVQNLDVAYFNHLIDFCYGMPNIVARISRYTKNRAGEKYHSRQGHIPGIWSPSEDANFWFFHLNHDPDESHTLEYARLDVENRELLRRILDNISAIQNRQYVFKCVYLSLNIKLLSEILPSARFLIVNRDPVIVCRSLYSIRKKQNDPGQWWSIKPPGYHEYLSKPLYEQIAFQVSASIQYIKESLQEVDSNKYMLIDYEKLCANPLTILGKIEKWLEPLGYRTQENTDIPDKFHISRGPELSSAENKDLLAAWKNKNPGEL